MTQIVQRRHRRETVQIKRRAPRSAEPQAVPQAPPPASPKALERSRVTVDVPAPRGSILEQHPPSQPIRITREAVVVGTLAELLWEAYLTNVDPLADVAILKHLDSREEFLAQLANPRIVKIVGWQADVPTGLAMVTNSLEDVAEISPRFLRAKYPEHAARNSIYVGMLVMVSQPLRGRTLFGRLYTELWQTPALASGILIFDVCEFNRTMFNTDQLTQRIADAFPRSSVSTLDRQTWYAVELPQPIGRNGI